MTVTRCGCLVTAARGCSLVPRAAARHSAARITQRAVPTWRDEPVCKAAARPASTGAPGYAETLPCKPESARRARSLVTSALSVWAMEELVDAATLVVVELLANTIEHTRCRTTRVTVRRLAEDRVRIGVSDTCQGPPVMKSPGRDAENGRGLVLVDALAERWGCDRHRAWKVVWAELRLEVGQPGCPEGRRKHCAGKQPPPPPPPAPKPSGPRPGPDPEPIQATH
ncbi:ATP-binding protein [Streptomyces eurythermus]